EHPNAGGYHRPAQDGEALVASTIAAGAARAPGVGWAATNRSGGSHEVSRRRLDQRVAASRDGIFPVSGADADCLERRIPADAADPAAERGRGPAHRAERPSREAPGNVAPPVLSDRGGNGGVVRRDEPGLWPLFWRQRGGSSHPRTRQS